MCHMRVCVCVFQYTYISDKTIEFVMSVYFSILYSLFCLFLQAIRHEAFTHMEAEKEFVQIDPNDLYPYLLVNVGSGVSIIKVFVYFCFFSSTHCCGSSRFHCKAFQSAG